MFEKAIFEKAVEQLQEELGRVPSGEETIERMADLQAKAIDEMYEKSR